MTAAEFLEALFAKPLTPARAEALYYREAGLGLGTRPWWPPLSEVWRVGAAPPPGENAEHWRAAHALLTDLHAQWDAARARAHGR